MTGDYSASVLGRQWWFRPSAAGILALAAMVAFGLMPVSASSVTAGPFTNSGIDVSYPNCNASQQSLKSTSPQFAIVGVTDGRPFTTYSCLSGTSGLWNAAFTATSPNQPSAYFNTGYSGAYGRDIVQACVNNVGAASASGNPHQQKQENQAWEIGCSEASYAYAVLNAMHEVPTMLFADIETSNSWSNNVTLNQYAIDGISWGMAKPVKLGYNFTVGYTGIYSSAKMWTTITGPLNWYPTPQVTANWVTQGTCPGSSTSPATLPSAFDLGPNSKTPTWLAQGAAIDGIDTDTVC